ncbi:MAG TPA: hypothetical protein VFE25_09270 [Opitutaceae bacterium]|nr:hypothetical protein [Opitutaceae bacterium]
MSLTWHIVRKDVTRLRWVILLWVVALAGEITLAAIQATLDAEGHVLFYMAAWTFGNVFIPVIGYGLVMGLQDDDPVTEGDSFWMTRPITGGRLLSAKALLAALFCLVPVAISVPFWLSHDFGLGALWKSSVHVLWRQVLISLLAVPFAVISSSGAKFVTNTLVGAVAVLGMVLLYRMVADNGAHTTPDAVLVSRGWIILCVWIVAAATAALNQFYRHRTQRSVAILVTAAFACFAVSMWWDSGAPALLAKAPVPDSAPVLVEVPAREGAHVSRDGRTVRVISLIPDFSRTIVVEVSESEPESSPSYPASLSEGSTPAHRPEHYVLVSQDDGRALTAEVTRSPEELHADRVRYFRSTLVFYPYRDLQGPVPSNIGPWIAGAVLVKVEGRDAALFKLNGPTERNGGAP